MEQNIDGKITLTDGSVIQGYTPQRVADQRIDNSLELDDTGEYFAVGGRKPTVKNKVKGEEGREFFVRNAFFFLSHSKEILADSRMFLARVPVVNGLAYTGTSGFRAPTLGVYLEWWNRCSDSVIELDGEKWLVWYISGSPLSGANACAIVNEKGETQTYSKLYFHNIWTSFTKINTRYDEAKEKYACFTLEEVVNIVRDNDTDKDKRGLMLDCFFLRSCNRDLAQRLQKQEERCKKLQNELTTAKIRLDIDWYRDVYRQYKEAEEAYLKRREELKGQRRELRRRLKSGELNDIEYQHLFQPISKELRTASSPSSSYNWDIRKKDADVSLYDVEKFFENEKKENIQDEESIV